MIALRWKNADNHNNDDFVFSSNMKLSPKTCRNSLFHFLYQATMTSCDPIEKIRRFNGRFNDIST